MKYFNPALLGLVALFGSQTILAGDISAGKEKAGVCAACHGPAGIAAMPGYPNLAGQNESYLVTALKSYRDKQRKGGMSAVMQMQAASLSDSDMANLAAYFSNLK